VFGIGYLKSREEESWAVVLMVVLDLGFGLVDAKEFREALSDAEHCLMYSM
jgi:hypothetical protein